MYVRIITIRRRILQRSQFEHWCSHQINWSKGVSSIYFFVSIIIVLILLVLHEVITVSVCCTSTYLVKTLLSSLESETNHLSHIIPLCHTLVCWYTCIYIYRIIDWNTKVLADCKITVLYFLTKYLDKIMFALGYMVQVGTCYFLFLSHGAHSRYFFLMFRILCETLFCVTIWKMLQD